MALDSNKYPIQGRLILNPTTWTTGGTDLGLIGAGHTFTYDLTKEQFTRQPTGTTPVLTRVTGVNGMMDVELEDYSSSIFSMLFHGMNNGNEFDGLTSYKLGHLLGSSNYFKLQIRPVNDDGTVDSTKPHLYIPKGLVIPQGVLVWDRIATHLTAMPLRVVAYKSSSYDVPFIYGDPATLPAIA